MLLSEHHLSITLQAFHSKLKSCFFFEISCCNPFNLLHSNFSQPKASRHAGPCLLTSFLASSKWVLLLSWATGSCYWVGTSREPFDLWSGVPVLGNKLVPFTWISFSNLDMFSFESCDLLQFSLNEIKNNEQLTSCFQENWWRRLPVETAFLKSGVRHRNT